MKLAIVGGRDYTDYKKVAAVIDEWLVDHPNVTIDTIVSGGATGIDTLAEQYADEHKLTKVIFPVTKSAYTKYGTNAPLKRNTSIVNSADYVLALPTKKSRGTYDTINKTIKAGKPLTVILLD